MQKCIEIITRQFAAKFKLDHSDAKRLEIFLAALIKDMQQGWSITKGEFWRRAAFIDGKPRCLSYNLFDAVSVISKFFPRFIK